MGSYIRIRELNELLRNPLHSSNRIKLYASTCTRVAVISMIILVRERERERERKRERER
jgi:hypothetical protein